jgi:hypothetical protein
MRVSEKSPLAAALSRTLATNLQMLVYELQKSLFR